MERSLFSEKFLSRVRNEVLERVHSGRLGRNNIYGSIQRILYEHLRSAGIPLTPTIRQIVGKTAWELYNEISKYALEDICRRLNPDELRAKDLNPEVVLEALSCPIESTYQNKENREKNPNEENIKEDKKETP